MLKSNKKSKKNGISRTQRKAGDKLRNLEMPCTVKFAVLTRQ